MKIDLSFGSDNSEFRRELDGIINDFKEINQIKDEINKPLIDDKNLLDAKKSIDAISNSARQMGEALMVSDKEITNAKNLVQALREQAKARESIFNQLTKEQNIREELEEQIRKIEQREGGLSADAKKKLFETNKALDEQIKKTNSLSKSYNSLSNSMRGLVKDLTGVEGGRTETDKLAKSLVNTKNETEALGEALSHLSKDGKKDVSALNQAFETSKLDSKQVSAHIREITEELTRMKLAGEDATDPERYEELTKRAREFKAELKNTRGDIDGQNQGLRRAILNMQEISSVASVVTGTMALFGLENDNIAKTLTRLNALMTIMNGLQGVSISLTRKDSIIRTVWNAVVNAGILATNRLRVALVSTGFGAIAVGVGYLVSKLVEKNEATEDAVKLGQRVSNQVGKEIADLHILRSTIEDNNRSNSERLKAIESLRKMYPDLLSDLSNEKLLVGEVSGAYRQLERSIIDVQIAQAFRAKAEDVINQYVESYMNYHEQVVDHQLLEKRQAEDILSLTAEQAKARKESLDATISSAREQGILMPELQAERDMLREKLKLDNSRNVALAEFNDMMGHADKFSNDLHKNIQGVATSTTKASSNMRDLIADLIKLEKDNVTASLRIGLEKELQSINSEFWEQADALIVLRDEFEKQGTLTEDVKQRIANLGNAYQNTFNEKTANAIKSYNEAIAMTIIEIDKALSDTSEIDAIENKYAGLYSSIDAELKKISEDRHLYNELQAQKMLKIEQQLQDKKKELRGKEAKEIADTQHRLFIESNKRIKDFVLSELTFSKAIFGDSKAIKLAEIEAIENYISSFGVAKEDIERYLKSGGAVDIKTFFGLDDASAKKIEDALIDRANAINRTIESNPTIFEKSGNSIGAFIALGISGSLEKELEIAVANAGKQIENLLGDMMQSIFDMQRFALESQIATFDANIAKIEKLIDAEKEMLNERSNMYDEDMASSFERDETRLNELEEQLEAEEQARAKAQREITEIEIKETKARFAMQSAQQIMDSSSALSAILKGSAQAMSASASIPFVGVGLGIVQAAALLSGFLAIRNKIDSMRKSVPTFGDGGFFDLTGIGHSHKQGGIGLYTQSGEKIAEYERDEGLYAINKKEMQRGHALPLLNMLNVGDLQGMQLMLSKINGDISNGDVRVKNSIEVTTDKEVSKGLNRLIEVSDKEVYVKQGRTHFKQGNKTTIVL